MYLISEDDVIHIHDQALNPGELQGLAGDKSLSGALSRVELRLACGLIKDAFDLSATCAVVISTGHVFNDGNKRTAFRCVAQGKVDESNLATWSQLDHRHH
ncbi:MAG: Fic family protein [Roseovarius sp.]|nr:Fic family protein [Roseovarius sp.]